MRAILSILAASTVLVAASATMAAADAPNVVVSIKPIHSLVAAIMEGVGEPTLIVDGAGSPHTYSMKPSNASALEAADIVFWAGDDLEAFLVKPIETLGANAVSVELIDADGLERLAYREGGAFEAHDDSAEGSTADQHDADEHGAHEHGAGASHDHKAAAATASHDDHAHGETAKGQGSHDDHAHETASTAAAEHDHDTASDAPAHEEHAHGAHDMHFWLDPVNAKAMARTIEQSLAAADPANAGTYAANAERLSERLDALVETTTKDLATVRGRPFIVFHDAYQYYEHRFGVTAAGSITVSPENIPGVQRVSEMQAKVRDLGATCVFAEPQFEPKLVNVVVEGTEARTGVLDPEGAALTNGPDLYFQLIEGLTASLKECLSQPS